MSRETGKPLAELGWRTRLKDPDAMAKITRERVIAAFDRLCTDKHLLPTQGNSEIPEPWRRDNLMARPRLRGQNGLYAGNARTASYDILIGWNMIPAVFYPPPSANIRRLYIL